MLAAILWCIWKSRNDAVFRGIQPKAADLINEAETVLILHNRWNPKKVVNRDLILSERWKPPTNPALKLNVDASICPNDINGAVAGVLRDSKGVLLDGFAEKIQAWSPAEAEAKALITGLKFLDLKKDTCRSVKVESDCCTLTEAVNTHGVYNWEAEQLISEAQHLLAQMPSVSVAHCDRRANLVADWAAKNHRLNSLPASWVSRPPPLLWNLLCVDAPSMGLLCKNSYLQH